jgi:chemotaxis signal transduction protein
MKRDEVELSGRLRELALEFDQSFARRPESRAQASEDFLAIRVASDSCVLRLSQIAGLFNHRKIVPLPSPVPELLGLASFRAAVVPVYDLCALLGRAREPEPRWLVLAAGLPVALGFSELLGHRRLATSDVLKEDRGQRFAAHAPEVARGPEGLVPVVDVASVAESIRRLTGAEREWKGA